MQFRFYGAFARGLAIPGAAPTNFKEILQKLTKWINSPTPLSPEKSPWYILFGFRESMVTWISF